MRAINSGDDPKAQSLQAEATVTDDTQADVTTVSRDPTKRIAIGAALLLAVLVTWYALADRWTPSVADGSTAAYVAQVAPRIAGQVSEVLVEDNAVVVAGQPLFRLDPATFEIDVQTQVANRAIARQQASTSDAAIRTAQAQVASAGAQEASVRAENMRIIVLGRNGHYAPVRVEQAHAAIQAAASATATARADLTRARTAAGPSGDENPGVQAAQSQLERAQQLADFSEVTAPAGGYITNLQLTEGQFLQAGAPGMTFIDPTRRWIMADLRENQLGNLEPGDPVEVAFDAAPGRIFRGRVESIAWGVSADRQTVAGLQKPVLTRPFFEPARRIPVRIVVDEPWPQTVRVGSRANVTAYAGGLSNPLSWIAMAILRVQGVLSYLY